MTRRYNRDDAALLQQYVTDVEGDVYCIYNLPEEVIAVIFAYVSRSPLSFRDNLLKLLRSDELDIRGLPGGRDPGAQEPGPVGSASQRAREFHERWTVGYGHASVAEHAVVRVGIERVSRFASALLETANPFLSFTEYSQRYQRPKAGAYYVPAELAADPDTLSRYRAFQDRCFQVYEVLLSGLHQHLMEHAPRRAGESEDRRWRRLEKLAFEDARYALSLAVHTNLGMTGNARAVRDALVVLLSSPWAEARALAEAVKGQVQKLVPTLLRYAEANPYRVQAEKALRQVAEQLAAAGERSATGGGPSSPVPSEPFPGGARLVDWTGRGMAPPGREEEPALDAFLSGAALAGRGMSLSEAARVLAACSLEEKRRWAASLLEGLGPHDHPADVTHRIRYSAEFLVSEANWHQLLRHCRRIDFLAEDPNPKQGLTVPPRVEEAGLAEPLRELAAEAEALWEELAARHPQAAPYVVINAHRRRVSAEFDLWEFYHLVNLRTSPQAQWDIRESVSSLYDQVAAVHPTLAAGARRRVGGDGGPGAP